MVLLVESHVRCEVKAVMKTRLGPFSLQGVWSQFLQSRQSGRGRAAPALA
jgi:hypothetical protein